MDHSYALFNPSTYSDVPLYNIQAVAGSTGVATITLRSWERRYGVPEPKRDSKGYRLYSERDIAITRWLKDRVQQGVGISRAVNMLRALESGSLRDAPAATLDFESLQERLLTAISRVDEAALNQAVSEALMVATVEEVALRLLQPVMYEVGERWAKGTLTATSEHAGSNLVRSLLGQLLRISPTPLRSERVLVGCAPGELHEIGALTLALFLRRRGFDVVYLGASVEPESLLSDIVRLAPAAVCMSANSMRTLNGLQALYGDVAHVFSGVRAFGGRIFNDDEDLRRRIDGVFLGTNAGEAATGLERAFEENAHGTADVIGR